MMHLFLNGLAADSGAGLTYIRNVVPHLSRQNEVRITVALRPGLRRELGDPANVSFLEIDTKGAAARFWREQTMLPKLIESCRADVLISAGNFSLRKSPVPQILLSGNSLYTSADFFRDLQKRRELSFWLDTRTRALLARRSILWADRTVAPSRAFADELRRWTGREVGSIYHGFDHASFFRDNSALPSGIGQTLCRDQDSLRILFVSHYNYYRNFETLLRAIPFLRNRLDGRKVRLFLTCKLSSGENPGSYRTELAASLVRNLGIEEEVVELGTVPYHLLHQVYRACHIYATAAYAETFAHPLVEAMASGLPVVASDLTVHREICGEAALCFPRFSPEGLAEQILRVARSDELAARLSRRGLARSRDFSWSGHVEQVLSLARALLGAEAR